MPKDEYKNISKVEDYKFADPTGSYKTAFGNASNMYNVGMGSAPGADGKGGTGFQGAMAGAMNSMDPSAMIRQFTQDAMPTLRQGIWDSPYASQMMDMNDRFVDRAAKNAAGQFAGTGNLFGGAAANAIGSAAQDAQNSARMQAMQHYSGLEQGLMGQAMGMYAQQPQNYLAAAGLYGNMAGQGMQTQAGLAQHSSGIAQPTYAKEQNWWDRTQQAAGMGANIASMFAGGGANPFAAAAKGISGLFGGGGAAPGPTQGPGLSQNAYQTQYNRQTPGVSQNPFQQHYTPMNTQIDWRNMNRQFQQMGPSGSGYDWY